MTSVARKQRAPRPGRTVGQNRFASGGDFAIPTLDESREALLEAIGPTPDLTFIRPIGNLGDELIWAGARELLSGHVYREIDIDALCSARGELAVIGGGGAWCHAFSSHMPELLEIAESRFERVIVLPTSFEVGVDRVRAALRRTKALVFARERDSFEQIRGFCRAELAHDLAFFVDLSAFDAPGEGELNAYRTDEERRDDRPPPPGNDDISLTAGSLESWLRTIERHRTINTDRAHVMIAGAMMGKAVGYSSSNYFKVDSLAETWLDGYDVTPLPGSRAKSDAAAVEIRTRTPAADPRTRVTIAVICRGDAEPAARAIELAEAGAVDARVAVFDRNSSASVRTALSELADKHPHTELRPADRDLGTADALRLAAELARSEFVIFLDERVRLRAGALDALCAALDAEPEAWAATPAVALPDETLATCGGWLVDDGETIVRVADRAGIPAGELADAPPAPTGFAPLVGTLFRRSALESTPPAGGFNIDCQSADWNLRAGAAGALLLACPRAIAGVPATGHRSPGPEFAERVRCVREFAAHARFLDRHDRVLIDDLGRFVPEFERLPEDERPAAARLLLAHVTARGEARTLAEWVNGGLDAVFGGRPEDAVAREAERERALWLEERNETLTAIMNGGWWRLRERLTPLRRAADRFRGAGGSEEDPGR